MRGNINISWLHFSFKNCKYPNFFLVAASHVPENIIILAETNLTTRNICERRKSVQRVRYICKNARKRAWMSINKHDSYNASVFQRDSRENCAIETTRRRYLESSAYCNWVRNTRARRRMCACVFTSVKYIVPQKIRRE